MTYKLSPRRLRVKTEEQTINLIKQVEERVRKEMLDKFEKMFVFKDNLRNLNNDRILLITEPDLKERLQKLREKK